MAIFFVLFYSMFNVVPVLQFRKDLAGELQYLQYIQIISRRVLVSTVLSMESLDY